MSAEQLRAERKALLCCMGNALHEAEEQAARASRLAGDTATRGEFERLELSGRLRSEVRGLEGVVADYQCKLNAHRNAAERELEALGNARKRVL